MYDGNGKFIEEDDIEIDDDAEPFDENDFLHIPCDKCGKEFTTENHGQQTDTVC